MIGGVIESDELLLVGVESGVRCFLGVVADVVVDEVDEGEEEGEEMFDIVDAIRLMERFSFLS